MINQANIDLLHHNRDIDALWKQNLTNDNLQKLWGIDSVNQLMSSAIHYDFVMNKIPMRRRSVKVDVNKVFEDVDYISSSTVSSIKDFVKSGRFKECQDDLKKDGVVCDFLKHRGVSDYQIGLLGTTKNLTESELELVGAIVHPKMQKFIGHKKIHGVLCPVRMKSNEIVGFHTRCLNTVPRLKWSSSIPNALMSGLGEAYSHDVVYVVEGYFDELAIKSLDYSGVISMNNAMPTSVQMYSLYRLIMSCSNKIIVLLLDNDNIGLNASHFIYSFFHELSLIDRIKFVELPEGAKDPAEFIIRDNHALKDLLSLETKSLNYLRNRIVESFKETDKEAINYSDYVKSRPEAVDWFSESPND